MIVTCSICQRLYDDTETWTICPHGPLWAPPKAYCLQHDLVDCQFHGKDLLRIYSDAARDGNPDYGPDPEPS